MLTGVEDAGLEDKHFLSSSRPASSTPASSTPAALLHLPPAGVEEGAGVEEAVVDEVRQPVAAGRGRF